MDDDVYNVVMKVYSVMLYEYKYEFGLCVCLW